MQSFFQQAGKKKPYYWWIGSYVAIIVLSIIINLIGYSVTLKVMEHEIEESSINSIEHMRNIYDSYFAGIIGSAHNLIQGSFVQRIALGENISQAQRHENVKGLINDISNTVYGSNIIEQCMVVIKNRDMCIENTGMGDMEMTYHSYFSEYYETEDIWLEDIYLGNNISDFKVLKGPKGTNQVYITYKHPLEPNNCMVLIKINMQVLNSLLENNKGEEGENYIITDLDGMVLFSGLNYKGANNIPQSAKPSSTHFVNGERQMISTVKSSVADFSYVRMIPNTAYLKNIRTVRTSFILSYLLCIVIGGALSYWFAEKHKQNQKKMEAKLKQQNKQMRESLLKQLLTNKVRLKNTDLAFLLEYNLIITGKLFVVVAFEFIKVLPTSKEDNTTYDYKALCAFLSDRISNNVPVNNAYFCEINELCFGLLDLDDDAFDILKLKQNLVELCSFFKKEMNFNAVCAISQPLSGISILNHAYEQVIEIMNFRFLGEDKTIFTYADVSEEPAGYEYSLETSKLINLLILGERELSVKMVEELFDYDRNVSRLNFSMLRILTLELVSTLLKASAQIEGDQTIDYKELFTYTSNLNNVRQFDAAKKSILKFIEHLCDASAQNAESVGNTQKNTGDSRCDKIIDFIEENYKDYELSVNMIAEKFNIGASWLSTTFKKQTGEGLAIHIVKYRIEKSKELLKSDLTINQIAEETGFLNADIYRRAFKRFENITPGQYRQLMSMDDSN